MYGGVMARSGVLTGRVLLLRGCGTGAVSFSFIVGAIPKLELLLH